LNRDNGSGEPYFVDSNIFFYAKIMDGEYGAACAEVLRRIEDRRILAATSTLVVLEVANSLRKFGLTKQVKDVVDSIFSLELRILEMSGFDVRNAIQISQRLNISAYDCAHVAVMQHAKIGKIVSADKDFDRVPGIRRKDPKTFSAT